MNETARLLGSGDSFNGHSDMMRKLKLVRYYFVEKTLSQTTTKGESTCIYLIADALLSHWEARTSSE